MTVNQRTPEENARIEATNEVIRKAQDNIKQAKEDLEIAQIDLDRAHILLNEARDEQIRTVVVYGEAYRKVEAARLQIRAAVERSMMEQGV